MANPTHPAAAPTSPPGTRPRSASETDRNEHQYNQAGGEPGSPLPEDDDAIVDDGRRPGKVEIGEPVPEDDRTVRADDIEEDAEGEVVDEEDTSLDVDSDSSDELH